MWLCVCGGAGVIVAGDSTGALFILRIADVMRAAEAERLQSLAIARASAAAELARAAEKQRELMLAEEQRAKRAAEEEAARKSGGINTAIITFPNGHIAQTLAMPRPLVRAARCALFLVAAATSGVHPCRVFLPAVLESAKGH